MGAVPIYSLFIRPKMGAVPIYSSQNGRCPYLFVPGNIELPASGLTTLISRRATG